MGIEPEKASPLVTNGRGTELGTRLLSGLAAPLMLRSTSAADTCRMPQDRPECQVPPRTGPPRGSFAFEEHAQNGSRSRRLYGKFLHCMAARDSALCASEDVSARLPIDSSIGDRQTESELSGCFNLVLSPSGLAFTKPMPIHPGLSDIALRLLCAAAAGFVIGYDRGEHGRPAGLRTTMLVSLAACIAMIQANLLLSLTGKSPDSFVVMDLMRLPLGILSGMGFIGAGAIVRRENLVLGVTTAATLWFVTVDGLCFGGGQIALGLAGLALGVLIITGLRQLEGRIKQEHLATLTVVITEGGPGEQEIRAALTAEHYKVRSCSLVYTAATKTQELTCQLSWRGAASDTRVPELVRAPTVHEGVAKVSWLPQTR